MTGSEAAEFDDMPSEIAEAVWSDQLTQLMANYWSSRDQLAVTPDALARMIAYELGRAFQEAGLPIEVFGQQINATEEAGTAANEEFEPVSFRDFLDLYERIEKSKLREKLGGNFEMMLGSSSESTMLPASSK